MAEPFTGFMRIFEPAVGSLRGITIDTLRRAPRPVRFQLSAGRLAPGRIRRSRCQAGYSGHGAPRSRRSIRIPPLLCRDEETQPARSHRRRSALHRCELLPAFGEEPRWLPESLPPDYTDKAPYGKTSEGGRRTCGNTRRNRRVFRRSDIPHG